ncbi:MAG: hypothetical protein ACI9HU_000626 [Colwellia sp.]|jgi:hypothetical protein
MMGIVTDNSVVIAALNERVAELEKESEFFYEVACESANPEWLRNQAKALKEQGK